MSVNMRDDQKQDIKSHENVLVLLTTRYFLLDFPLLESELQQLNFEVCAVETWSGLLDRIENNTVDVVIIDMDSIIIQKDNPYSISGRRLVTLLNARLVNRYIPLIVLTTLDFVEIEDLARSGVRDIVPLHADISTVIKHILTATARTNSLSVTVLQG